MFFVLNFGVNVFHSMNHQVDLSGSSKTAKSSKTSDKKSASSGTSAGLQNVELNITEFLK